MNLAQLFLVVCICASSVLLEAQHQIVLPMRRAPEQSVPPLPSLPDGADEIEPVTMDVVLQGQPGKILYTVSRILVISSQREWLFERNSLDTRRVSATIVEHAKQAIIEYEESDVRNLLGLNGWADVLEFTSKSRASDSFLRVTRVSAGVNEKFLRPSHVRFPTYKRFDVAEWLEGR